MNVFDPICTLIKMKCSWSCPCHEAALPAAQILVREGWRGVFVRPGLDLRSECECVLLPREPASNLLRSHPTLQPTLPQLCYKWEPASPCRLLPSPLKQSRHGWRAKNSKTTAPVSGGRSVRVLGSGGAPCTLGHRSLPDSATDIQVYSQESVSAAGRKLQKRSNNHLRRRV